MKLGWPARISGAWEVLMGRSYAVVCPERREVDRAFGKMLVRDVMLVEEGDLWQDWPVRKDTP